MLLQAACGAADILLVGSCKAKKKLKSIYCYGDTSFSGVYLQARWSYLISIFLS
jgi:hypothetical protein